MCTLFYYEVSYPRQVSHYAYHNGVMVLRWVSLAFLRILVGDRETYATFMHITQAPVNYSATLHEKREANL